MNISQNPLKAKTAIFGSRAKQTKRKNGMSSLALTVLACAGVALVPFLIIVYVRFRVAHALKSFGTRAQACKMQYC
jgi:hypothetical protein